MRQGDLICTECPLRDCDEQSLWCGLRLAQGKPNWLQKRKMLHERQKAKRIRQLIADTEQAHQEKIAELYAKLAQAGKWHPIVHRQSSDQPGQQGCG